jgi:hypothetical protein
MAIPRYYTVGAVVPDARSLRSLGDRLDALDLAPGFVVVLTRRRDERLTRTILPEAHVGSVESSLSASTVSFLMAVVHLWTGLVVQAVLTIAAVVGLIIYHRHPHVQKRLLSLGMPERLAKEWEASFPAGFALLLATVPEEEFEEAQSAFLLDDTLLSPLAVDRRPVL